MLPSFKRIQREDVADAPSWILRMIVPINNFFQNVYSILTKNVTFEDNIRSESYDLVINGSDSTAEIVLNGVVNQVNGVLLTQITPAPLAGATITWQQVGNELQILNITGLDPAEQYNLRILTF